MAFLAIKGGTPSLSFPLILVDFLPGFISYQKVPVPHCHKQDPQVTIEVYYLFTGSAGKKCGLTDSNWNGKSLKNKKKRANTA